MLEGDGNMSMVGTRQEQHVIEHARQPLIFFHIGYQQSLIFFLQARLCKRHLGLHHQIIDWRAQVVRQVGRKLRQPLETIVQTVQHAIEGHHQLL